MLKSLTLAGAPAAQSPFTPNAAPVPIVPQVVSPVVAPAVKVNPPEQNALLIQFPGLVKPAPRAMSASELKELQEFLKAVAEGEQDKAEAMLKKNPALALVPGNVGDLSGRTFSNITGFQYAVWALDWHMWTMIRKYLPDGEAKQQAEGIGTGTWVRQHGVNAQHLLDNLVKALQATIDLYKAGKYTECDIAWVQQVGGAQFLLPAHVVNEYCYPARSLDPCPNFKDVAALPRTRKVNEGEWFTAVYNGGKLGEKFAVRRGRDVASADVVLRGGAIRLLPVQCAGRDCDSVRALTNTRTAQREELIAELRHRSVQRDALALAHSPQSPPVLQPVVNLNPSPINNPQATSAAVIVPKPNPPEQKNPPAMLTQLNQVFKPAPKVSIDTKVNADDLNVFLKLIAEGEQDKAEAMLKSNPALALAPSDVTDLSKRIFTGITAFQYAVWALDWHMWTMIKKYLPIDEAKRQVEEAETSSWVKQHGVNAQHLLENLVKALQVSIDLYNASKHTESSTAWIHQVGGAQLLLPAHVINEYCHPTRPAYPFPNFREVLALPRSRTIDQGEWFTAAYGGGLLGDKFAVERFSLNQCSACSHVRYRLDHNFIHALTSTRAAQREELIFAELRVRHEQKPDDLKVFLRLVAEGEQDKAENMLRINPYLALQPGDVTDLSKRTFIKITAFQYAVWALDWHMWTMIKKYLPDEAAKEQAQGFETGPWVKHHGVNAQYLLENLVKALQTTIKLHTKADNAVFQKDKKHSEAMAAWVQQVGGAQLLLPVHVIHEYCHPARSFKPCPNFKDTVALPRGGAGSWFTELPVSGKLAEKFAIYRGCEQGNPHIWKAWGGPSGPWAKNIRDVDKVSIFVIDCDCVRALSSTRTAQREELITSLKPKNSQKKVV